MNADVKGSLEQLNKGWRFFEHNGQSMSKTEVKAVLEFALKKGYKSTKDISDYEIDNILNTL